MRICLARPQENSDPKGQSVELTGCQRKLFSKISGFGVYTDTEKESFSKRFSFDNVFELIRFKVAPFCFLKSGKRQISTSKSTMNISEKNEIKAMYRITFRASNSVNG